jgi:hypothetical protein
MKTRVGKIARLPKEIREQLNRRLEDGERGKDIVQWLNTLPEVQKVITEQFAGHAIREQNLSDWRNGGYLDWLRHQDTRQQVRCIAEQAWDLGEDEGDEDLSELLAFLITAELVTQWRALNNITDPAERWNQFRQISRELSRVRRDDQRYRRTELRREQFESTLEPAEEECEPDTETVNETETGAEPKTAPPQETKEAPVACHTEPQQTPEPATSVPPNSLEPAQPEPDAPAGSITQHVSAAAPSQMCWTAYPERVPLPIRAYPA